MLVRAVAAAIAIGALINGAIAVILRDSRPLEVLSRVSWTSFAVPFFCLALLYLIDSLRYGIVFSAFGISVPFRERLYNNVIGALFSNLTPFASGGQPFQLYHFHSIGIDSSLAANVVFTRTIAYMAGQFLLGALLFNRALRVGGQAFASSVFIYLGLGTSFAMTALMTFVFLRPERVARLAVKLDRGRFGRLVARVAKRQDWAESFVDWCKRLGASVRELWARRPLVLLADMALNLAGIALAALALYWPARALSGRGVEYLDLLAVYVVASISTNFFPTPGASGSAEAGFSLLLASVVGSASEAFAAAAVWRFSTYYLHVFFGLAVYFLYSPQRIPAMRV